MSVSTRGVSEGKAGDLAYRDYAIMDIAIHADATGGITLTNQAAAEAFLAGNARHVKRCDLTGKSQVRISIMNVTGGAAGAKVYVIYRTAFSATVGQYSAIGTSAVEASIAASSSHVESNWIDLAEGAKADVFIGIAQSDGDASASPVIGNIHVQVR